MALAISTLWQREIVRFYRQRSRIIGALATPVLFWLVLGSGFAGSFQATAKVRNEFSARVLLRVSVLYLPLLLLLLSATKAPSQ